MKLKPLFDYLLVRPEEPESVTASGILIADSALEKSMKGVVIEVGFGKEVGGKMRPVCVKQGATILFSRYAGDEVRHEGDKLLLIRESDILAVVEND